MPELPDIEVYVDALARRIEGATLTGVRIANPFLLRTAVPALSAVNGRRVAGVRRLGKRIVLEMEGGLYLVMHLMRAGRLRWADAGGKVPKAGALADLVFSSGTLVFTEAGTRRRASLHVLGDAAALAAMDPGGLEILQSDRAAFTARLTGQNRTLKRALTDPHTFSGIGNAYSDEILHRARLSPLALSQRLSPEEIEALHEAARAVLTDWTTRLMQETGAKFPDKVTAFRPGMAVHGRFGQPCPVCGAPVQRIVHADNETNYCARCQTGGRVLADRALSRLLKDSWPRDIDDLE